MFSKRFVCLLAAAVCLVSLGGAALALEVDCDATYCFTQEDLQPEQPLSGICITGLPDADVGTVLLGSRVIRPGDILTAQQLEQMTFVPLRTETDQEAVVTYLPIYENRVAPATTMTISIRGKVDQAPAAEDFALETYKNLPNEGNLKVSDPEGQKLSYTVVRNPRRGTVAVSEDGSFVYTPKKNKVGVDSFTYTATDPCGNVSREATVTIQILKPSDSKQYADTVGMDCRFTAEWMKNTGLFVGEQVGDTLCFNPEKTVSRGEFLTMVIQALDIPVDKAATYTGYADAPAWLTPYLAAALRTGLTAGWPSAETFGEDEPITGAQAAVMLQNALDLPGSGDIAVSAEEESDTPAWAQDALAVMSSHGITFRPTANLTRGEVSAILYRISKLAASAPGLQVYQ